MSDGLHSSVPHPVPPRDCRARVGREPRRAQRPAGVDDPVPRLHLLHQDDVPSAAVVLGEQEEPP
eukprot:5513254-Lingulodinium_polyedra.AAC.1